MLNLTTTNTSRSGRAFLASGAAHLAATALLATLGGSVVVPVYERRAVVLIAPAPEKVREKEPVRPPFRVKKRFEMPLYDAVPEARGLVFSVPPAPNLAPAIEHPLVAIEVAPHLPPAPAPAAAPEKPRLIVDAGFAALAVQTAPSSTLAAAQPGGFGEVRAGGDVVAKKGAIAAGGFGAMAVANRRERPSSSPAPARFGDVSVEAPTRSAPPKERAPLSTSVEIVDKPRPAYTAEARALRIEGEVLLNVIFTATGEVRVLGIRSGLGHGLDENAVTAARAIRFRPALREGQAVDTAGIIHIEFELAY
jgi:TonB family protein